MWGRLSFHVKGLASSHVAHCRFSRSGLGDSGLDTVFNVRDLQPPLQAGLGDPEVFRDPTDRSFALPGDRDDVATELFRNCFRHVDHLSVRTKILTG